ncbi:MAG: tetratricopeptide repeat protein [Chloroflexi bacterium]|nr:tetratricopeptide repeat protein [Chloroflexota bacterium]
MLRQHLSSRLLAASLALVLLVSACTMSGKTEVVRVTATPQPQDIQVTRPYVTPTPPAVPTPTVEPHAAVSDAQRALRNGDFVSAVTSFEAVSEQPDADPALRASAAYGLGEANLREGLYQEAATALTRFLSEFPDDARVPQAHFLRGDAYLGLSEWQRAISDFTTYVELRPGLIDSYAYERIGDAYLALGQPEHSLDAYAKAAEATREVTSLVALRERLAASYLNAGQPGQAVAQYDAILNDARNNPYRASIMFQAAQVQINNGNTNGGYARLQQIVSEYPDTYPAYQAMGILLEAGLPVDTYERAVISFNNEDYNSAIQLFNEHTSQSGTAPPELLMMLGQSYREIGNAQAAITTFQNVIDSYPADPAFGQAHLEQGRTLFLGGDVDGAIEKYLSFATNYPTAREAAEALWRAGYLYSTQENLERAVATFETLGQNHAGSSWAQEGLYMGATLAYNQDNIGMAAQLFSRLATIGTGENKAAALLWVGRLYQRDGKDDLARQAFQAAATADPGGYYSLRADDLLHGREPFTPPAAINLDADEAVEIAEAEAWLRQTFAIEQESALYPLSDAFKADPRMIRGQELMAVADYSAAEDEFESLRVELQDDPLATYQLAMFFRDVGLNKLSITAAATLLTEDGVDESTAPRLLRRLRYPVYYKDLVLPEAEANNLDPLLVFSLIRQESLFEGLATSFAAAQGLMQIIPDTGEWIALQMRWPNYQNSDVYRPYINVKFGTYYLRWVLDQVDNLPYVALAGYNGGPGNAMQWLGISGPDLDLFVQTITYDETRTYVRRIYEQYSVYRDLYGAQAVG